MLQDSETHLYGHLITTDSLLCLRGKSLPIFCKSNLLIIDTPLTWTFSTCMTPSESFFCALGYLSIQENFGSHVTIIMSTCPTASQGNQCEMVHFLASVVACHPILHILVVVNWQLSKQGIRWPVSRDHTVGSVDPSRLLVHVFLSLPLTSFLFSTDRKLNSNYWISLLLCFFINGSSALSLV